MSKGQETLAKAKSWDQKVTSRNTQTSEGLSRDWVGKGQMRGRGWIGEAGWGLSGGGNRRVRIWHCGMPPFMSLNLAKVERADSRQAGDENPRSLTSPQRGGLHQLSSKQGCTLRMY